jgi:hypothetical protein
MNKLFASIAIATSLAFASPVMAGQYEYTPAMIAECQDRESSNVSKCLDKMVVYQHALDQAYKNFGPEAEQVYQYCYQRNEMNTDNAVTCFMAIARDGSELKEKIGMHLIADKCKITLANGDALQQMKSDLDNHPINQRYRERYAGSIIDGFKSYYYPKEECKK